MTTTGQFFDEIIASAILMFSIYALKDDGNIGAGPLTPLGCEYSQFATSIFSLFAATRKWANLATAVFFVIFGIGACWGWETGYAINAARDFGPRLMSYFLGYGNNVWTAGSYYFWVCRKVLALT